MFIESEVVPISSSQMLERSVTKFTHIKCA
jgi:hypothetical protein